MIVDNKRINKALENSSTLDLIENLVDIQKKQGKELIKAYDILTKAIGKLDGLFKSMDKSSTDTQNKIINEAKDLNSQLQQSLASIADSGSSSDISDSILKLSAVLEQQSPDISDSIKELSDSVSKDKEWDFNIVRDSYGKMTQIKAKLTN
jgi:hypothetical protein